MKRKKFLQATGMAGIATLMPVKKFMQAFGAGKPFFACTLTPDETAGPYPYDLSGNASMYRSNITESKTGIPLTLTLTVTDTNCNIVSGARVDIWHCDKDGYYSEYSENGYLGTLDYTGKTFLRGIQTTDSNGQVSFTTIYPGWYTPRVTHIHVEVFINSVLQKTTQLAFPDSLNTTVYNTSLYTAHGQNTTVNSTDQVFSGSSTDLALETFTVSGDTTNGYSATRSIVLDASALPLSLLSFNAGISGKQVMLWWTTVNELDMDYFVIERSNNSEDSFVGIGKVAANNSTGKNNYSFNDASPLPGRCYYRLRMVDKDGLFTYSPVASFNNTLIQNYSVSPNPASSSITIGHPSLTSYTTVNIITEEGKFVSGTYNLPEGSTATAVDVSRLPVGFYFVVLYNKNDKHVLKFIKK